MRIFTTVLCFFALLIQCTFGHACFVSAELCADKTFSVSEEISASCLHCSVEKINRADEVISSHKGKTCLCSESIPHAFFQPENAQLTNHKKCTPLNPFVHPAVWEKDSFAPSLYTRLPSYKIVRSLGLPQKDFQLLFQVFRV